MSLEELLQEHIKALRENTEALNIYTRTLQEDKRAIDVEYTKNSACSFCGITYKTMQNLIANGDITPRMRKGGRREFFKESDLIALCEAKKFYAGEYGGRRS